MFVLLKWCQGQHFRACYQKTNIFDFCCFSDTAFPGCWYSLAGPADPACPRESSTHMQPKKTTNDNACNPAKSMRSTPLSFWVLSDQQKQISHMHSDSLAWQAKTRFFMFPRKRPQAWIPGALKIKFWSYVFWNLDCLVHLKQILSAWCFTPDLGES